MAEIKARKANTKSDGTVKAARRKKEKKNIAEGIAHIQSSFNNTIVSITDLHGNVICWSSAGAVGFKGAKKSTPYAASLVAQAAMKAAVENGLKSVSVKIKGIGPGKDSALRQIQATANVTVKEIKNVTPTPHNGVKLKKKFRNMEAR